jgi:hypothetical protein
LIHAEDFSTRSSAGFDREDIMSLEKDFAVVFSFRLSGLGPFLGVVKLLALLSVRIPEDTCIKPNW